MIETIYKIDKSELKKLSITIFFGFLLDFSLNFFLINSFSASINVSFLIGLLISSLFNFFLSHFWVFNQNKNFIFNSALKFIFCNFNNLLRQINFIFIF